ncbi:MAG: UxaA family hydrolase [Lachnospiraceae bacterium]|nr:UxaA family hydrolase [Lachnospiraceae bacterium]
MEMLQLYPREAGHAGVRNRIAVISTVACANHVADLIAAGSPLADPYTHPYGCDQMGDDLTLSFECLKKMGTHPNNGACLVVGLGCEEIDAAKLCLEIRKERHLCEYLIIQEEGGTSRSVEKGTSIIKRFEEELQSQQRVPMPLSELTIGLECGGSDFTSGLAANPSLGKMSERLAAAGCRIVFGETAELMGAEGVLEKLCVRKSDYEWICSRIRHVEDVARDMKIDLRGTQPSPGNIRGGLTTIEEKSLGAVCKIGSLPIEDALPFGQSAVKPGVSFMDTPGNDLACSLGLAAAGAQIIFFTTGRGSPMGFAACPVIKLTGNAVMAKLMAENIDADLSGIVDRSMSIEEGGELLYRLLLETAGGKETASEKLGHREFSLYRTSPILT